MWYRIKMTDLLRLKVKVALYQVKRGKALSLFLKKKVLTITLYTNLIETDFLDVTFNLATGKFFSI